jgi:hypothetical protein
MEKTQTKLKGLGMYDFIKLCENQTKCLKRYDSIIKDSGLRKIEKSLKELLELDKEYDLKILPNTLETVIYNDFTDCFFRTIASVKIKHGDKDVTKDDRVVILIANGDLDGIDIF